mmetsp:Transcript_10910/g.26440  ORF Transcript_10910/g.26440 Transcript_10910/m.26440 type:complete len:245 (-) Transcript_10910:306-1040(-)
MYTNQRMETSIKAWLPAVIEWLSPAPSCLRLSYFLSIYLCVYPICVSDYLVSRKLLAIRRSLSLSAAHWSSGDTTVRVNNLSPRQAMTLRLWYSNGWTTPLTMYSNKYTSPPGSLCSLSASISMATLPEPSGAIASRNRVSAACFGGPRREKKARSSVSLKVLFTTDTFSLESPPPPGGPKATSGASPCAAALLTGRPSSNDAANGRRAASFAVYRATSASQLDGYKNSYPSNSLTYLFNPSMG